jgi:small subunit ribosomal protein S16
MLRLKLKRIGKKKQPSFRIIVLERHKDPYGDFLEDLGFWNRRTKEVSLKKERIKYWLSKGAQPTPPLYNLLISQGILKGKKIAVHKKPKKKKEEGKEKEKERKN